MAYLHHHGLLAPATGPPPKPAPPHPAFQGNVDECPICWDAFEEGDRVSRLPCRHALHTSCWEAQRTHGFRECPVCRGGDRRVAEWHWVSQHGPLTQIGPDGTAAPNLLELGPGPEPEP